MNKLAWALTLLAVMASLYAVGEEVKSAAVAKFESYEFKPVEMLYARNCVRGCALAGSKDAIIAACESSAVAAEDCIGKIAISDKENAQCQAHIEAAGALVKQLKGTSGALLAVDLLLHEIPNSPSLTPFKDELLTGPMAVTPCMQRLE